MHGAGVLEEAVDDIAVGPAAGLLQCLRHVPVVQRQPRQNVGTEQLIDEALVEVDARRVHRSPVGTHPRPRRREAVGLQPETLHERDVVAVAVVVIARDIAALPADDGPGNAREGIPDRRCPTVFEGCALDLVGGGGSTEEKALGEGAGHSGHPFTAPAMMPLTSCLPATTKRTRSGRVASTAPVSTIE